MNALSLNNPRYIFIIHELDKSVNEDESEKKKIKSYSIQNMIVTLTLSFSFVADKN